MLFLLLLLEVISCVLQLYPIANGVTMVFLERDEIEHTVRVFMFYVFNDSQYSYVTKLQQRLDL